MKARHIITTLSVLVAGTVVGATTQHMASADVSAGNRPVLVPIEPCRLADTRPPPQAAGPKSTPAGPAETVVVNSQQTDTKCTGKIPADATALSLNITALGATELSFLTVWADGERPLAASLNPAAGQPPVPNAVTTNLAADNTFRIYNDKGNVNLVVDVNGYYSNHDHDDRYFTEGEVITALAAKADTAAVYTQAQVDALVAPKTTTEYYSVAAWEFEARYSDTATKPFPANQFDGKTFVNSSGGDSVMFAPVHLPNGAEIVTVTWAYYDTSVADLALRLHRITGEETETIAEAASTGTDPGRRVVFENLSNNPIVDNTTQVLLLSASRQAWATQATAEETAVGDVVITYRITR